jgi:hypothetical protein
VDQGRISNKEYVEHITCTAENAEKGIAKRKQRFRLFTLVAIVLCAATTFYAYSQNEAGVKKAYASYISGEQTALTEDLLQYKDTYAIYERNALGNSNAELLTGGYFLTKNSIVVAPNENLTNTFLTINDRRESLCGQLSSYVNIYNDYVYFRCNSDRWVYKKLLSGGKSETVIEQNVGQLVVAEDYLYYIDLGNANALMALRLTDLEKPILLRDSVNSFSVFQNMIIYLNSSNELRLFNQETKIDTFVAANSERFFFNGKLIVQNNHRINVITLDGVLEKQFSFPDIIDVSLIDVEGNTIYFQSADTLYSYDTVTKVMDRLFSGYEFYASVHSSEGRLLAFAADIDSQYETVSREVVEVEVIQ